MIQIRHAAAPSVGLMLLSVLLFALNTLLIRGLALQSGAVDGWLASLFRGAVGLLFVIACFGFGRGLRLGRVFARPLLLARGVLGACGIVCFYVTVVHLGAARAVVINLSYPIFATVIAAFVLGERPTTAGMAWMAAGFAGLVVFLGGGLSPEISGYDLVAVAGALAAGGVVVLIRRLRRIEHTATIYAAQCVFSVILCAPVAGGACAGLSVGMLGALSAAAVVVAIAQLAMTHAYRDLSVARGSAIQMLLPVVTGIGGYFFFSETFTVIELCGAALTLVSTWRVLMQARAPHPRPAAGAP